VQSTDARRGGADQIDGFLLRIFVAVMEERSASRAAVRLNVPQPTISAALNRLRRALGDPLLTRGRHAMVPTERAESMLPRARLLVDELGSLCAGPAGTRPAASRRYAIGAFDYIGPDFVPIVVNEVLHASPLATVHVHQLSVDYDYMEALENGPLDLVVGNWGEPAPQLRHLNLFADEIVCLVRQGHPLARAGFDRIGYLDAEHVGLIPYHVDRLGVIDAYLAKLGLKRNIRVVLPTFNGVAHLVARTDLVFTTCRSFVRGHARELPLRVLPAPIALPPMTFRLLWHERSHRAAEHRLIRTNIAAALKRQFPAGGRAEPAGRARRR
jgi:DNA-binding transcriptional LysR family regulator